MHSALIIGGDSVIGKALATELQKSGLEVFATSRRNPFPPLPLGEEDFISEAKPSLGNPVRAHFFDTLTPILSRRERKIVPLALDLSQLPESWPNLPQADAAFLCAAITKLEACENDPAGTALINVDHMQEVASELLSRGIYTVFLSSNQVFDGSKPRRLADEVPCPLNVYGAQKAEMEAWLMSGLHCASVLRLTKVITSSPLPVLAHWETDLKAGNSIEAFTDLSFSPIPLASVVQAMVQLGRDKEEGIFQLSGAQEISYYEIALALATRLKISRNKVIPISATSKGIRPQFLPQHGTLEPSKIFAHIHCPEPLDVIFA